MNGQRNADETIIDQRMNEKNGKISPDVSDQKKIVGRTNIRAQQVKLAFQNRTSGVGQDGGGRGR